VAFAAWIDFAAENPHLFKPILIYSTSRLDYAPGDLRQRGIAMTILSPSNASQNRQSRLNLLSILTIYQPSR
jgi:hypothetical protein